MRRNPSSSPISDPSSIIPAFASVIKALRRHHELTQEQLAWRTNVDQSFISALERGLKEPCLKTMAQLAAAFDLPLAQLIAAVEEKQHQQRSQLRSPLQSKP